MIDGLSVSVAIFTDAVASFTAGSGWKESVRFVAQARTTQQLHGES